MIERRREPRTRTELVVTVWGIDTHGERFLQAAHAKEISISGALLTQLDAELRCGDLIGVEHAGTRAHFRVVWIRESGNDLRIEAAIHRLEEEPCPWEK